MSVVSFWSQDKKETGQTASIVALATYMAIEHNYRILIVSTSYNDDTLHNCFWGEEKVKRNLGLFGPNTNVVMQNGIEGLNRFIRSNKANPDIVTNYTKIVFKDRLEVLLGYKGEKVYYDDLKTAYPSIIELASKYYDLVLVDIDRKLDVDIQKEILHSSNLVVSTMTQRVNNINKYMELRKENNILNSAKTLILIGRYDRFSKYTAKNITRYLREKNEVTTIPYNTLFFEASEEAAVADLFLKLRKIKDETDRNAYFLKEIKRLSENIIYRLQDLQMGLK